MKHEASDKVTIVEVAPRDGLQNETAFVAIKQKIEFINLLSQTGLTRIEATSFVLPKIIPQLADSAEVFKNINKPHGVRLSALVPNIAAMEKAIQLGVQEISVFTAASETFNQHNINCSIAESIQRFVPVMELAKQNNIFVRGYVSCALGCPYEGNIQPQQVLNVAEQLLALRVDEISFADTIGIATPKPTLALLQVLQSIMPCKQIAMHFHDTYGQAIANIYAALEFGIRCFDSTVAGLGGCPYAPGATGNVATEDVLYLMQGLGMETGIDFAKIVAAGQMICAVLGRQNQSKAAIAYLANLNNVPSC